MRISDWSSDVYSSDLGPCILGQHWWCQLGHRVQEERAARGLEAPRRTAEHQRAELEAGVGVGEEDFLVLDVEQGTEQPRRGKAAEERRRPLGDRKSGGEGKGG